MSEPNRYAVIENGIVTNVVLATEEYAAGRPELVETGEGCVIGGTYEGGEFGPVPVNLDALLTERLAEAERTYDDQRQRPLSWDFGSTTAKDDDGNDLGAAGVQTLQMRDDGVKDDLKNWLAASQGASLAVMASAGAMIQPIKTTANVWVQTTAQHVLAVLVAGDGVQTSALERGRLCLAAFGAVKKALAAAEGDEAALRAVDVAAGYP